MTKLLESKPFRAFAAIAMAVLLTVSLVPSLGLQPAYAETGSLITESGNRTNAEGTIPANTTVEGAYAYTSGSHTLTVNGTLKGQVHVGPGATLTLEGTGTIQGAGSAIGEGSVVIVEGADAKLVLSEGNTLTITGGTGTLINADDRSKTKSKFGERFSKEKDPRYIAGGGILVQRDSEGNGGALLVMRGEATITGNRANAGGGIFVDRECGFLMEGGTVTGNVAEQHEGGGLFIAGRFDGENDHATIVAGDITDNRTETTIDWGGGGIFVENRGILKLESVLITDNEAQGLGGGVSGCPHASIAIGDITEGAAIYGNAAAGTSQPSNEYLHVLKTDSSVTEGEKVLSGDMYFYGLTSEKDWLGKGSYVDDYAKDAFSADYAQDYYCTKVSSIHGYDLGQEGSAAWTGFIAGPSQKAGRPITIAKGETFPANDTSLGLTNTYDGEDIQGRSIRIADNASATHGGGIGCNGSLLIGNLDSVERFAPIVFEFKKNLVNSEGEALALEGRIFEFALYETRAQAEVGADPVARAVNGTDGTVRFELDGEAYLKDAAQGDAGAIELYLRELPGADGAISYDDNLYKVRLAYTVERETVCIVANSVYLTSCKAVDLASVIVREEDGAVVEGITNTLNLEGAWVPTAQKFYYGDAQQPVFDFALEEINAPADLNAVDFAALSRKDGPCFTAQNGAFAGSEAPIVFDAIIYGESGEHWYKLYEMGGADPTVYVAKVVVAGNNAAADSGASSTELVATVAGLWYADSPQATMLRELGINEPIEFHNNDEGFSAQGYAVNALSGAPLSQKCLVDPKIVKALEGRTMVAGEFSFQLIEVADYADTTGEVISETSNDADGMVDFDAAANKADEGWEPSCLLFTQPGTYKYRVVEDPSQKADPSIEYSTEAITFTVVVELDRATGVLAATDMYYGYLNEAGENVRYKEQYQNWQAKGADWVPSAADFPDLDVRWHPTMTNRAKSMDFAVQKTSTLTGEALAGATYALYRVGEGDEADLRLAESTSDTEGWMYFKDVSLKSGVLYYLLEEKSPEGHTVNAGRSRYFYVVPDAEAANGFGLRYTDNKYVLEEASDELVAVHEATPDADFGGNEAQPPTTRPVYGPDGALLYVYEADGGVQDDATSVAFNKLEAGTHEWVEGAKLSVVEKETGRVVSSWTSSAASEVLEKTLNVDTVYVLREDEAPADYECARPVEFRISAYGVVEVLSGTEGGNAEAAGSVITLYDGRTPTEEVVTETREVVREKLVTRTLLLAQTGDRAPLAPVGAVALGALAVLALAVRQARRRASRQR